MKAVNYLGQVLQTGGGGGGGATFSGGFSTGGNTAGDTGLVTNRLVLAGGNNITLSGSTNAGSMTVTISAGAAGGSVNFSAGTTSNNLASVVFSNSNGVSFGLNGSTITGSIATSLTNVNLSAGTTSNNLSAFVFSNSNNVSFGLNGSTVTGTATVASTQGSINLSAGTTSNLASAFTFSNSNNVSFGLNGSTVTATATVGSTQGSINLSAGTTSNLASAFTFSNSNGLSFGLNASTITASHNALTSQSNQNVTAANGGFAFQTLSFSNANNFSFGTSAGSAITGSYTVPTVTNSSWTVSDSATSVTISRLAFTNSNGVTMTLSTGAGAATVIASHNGITSQSNQQMTIFATGNTTLSSTGTSNASSLIFRGSGAASIGITNGSVLIDVAAGAAAITQSIGISTQTAGGSTAGTSGYATGDDILYHFVPGSNITMSQSLNGASATLSIYGPAGGGVTLSGFDGYANNEFIAIAGGQATLWIDRIDLGFALQFDRLGLRITHSNATNSSGSGTISAWACFYTRNASTLSSLHSTSFTTAFTQSGTVGSYSNYGGIRILPIPWTTTVTGGNYWLAIVSRTTTGGANMTFGNLANSQIASTMSGFFGSGSNATRAIRFGVGVYSATTSGIPATIGFTQINGNSSAFLRQPAYLFMSNIF